MLSIDNVEAGIAGKTILNGLSLEIKPGEVHAIMGPNGAGKSTLSNLLAGKPGLDVSKGSVTFENENLLEMSVDERANQGLFLAMQYPVELPGVNALTFLKESMNAKRLHQGEEALNSGRILKTVRNQAEQSQFDAAFLKRSVNEGFSGGEKKRFEIFQMSLLKPKLCILDEIDSGLDIDALKAVADDVNALRNEGRSFLMITHYQRLLDYIKPDFVHVLADGKIAASGDYTLAEKLEAQGYGWIEEWQAA